MNQKMQWLFGAALLLCGWIIGYIAGDRPAAPRTSPNHASNVSGAGFTSSAPKSAGVRVRAAGPTGEGEGADEFGSPSEQGLLGALREPNDPRRAHDLYEAISRMSEAEVSAAIEMSQRLPALDREALLPILQQMPAGAIRNNALQNLASNLAYSDPQAAARLAEEIPPGDARNNTVSNIAGNWARYDVVSALAWVQQLGGGDGAKNALRNISYQWAQTDPKAATAYFAALPGAEKDGILARVAQVWAGT